MNGDNRALAGSIGAGVAGGAVFATFLLLGLPIIACAGLGIAGFAGTKLLLYNKKRSMTVYLDSDLGSGLEEVLLNAGKKIREIRSLKNQISKVEVKEKIEKICLSGDDILADIEKHPEDFKPAKKFLSYYLDTTLKIITRYVEFSTHKMISGDMARSMAKVESLLDTIQIAFRRELAHLLEDDVLDLDTEIDVMEKTIKLEGFGGNEYEK